MKKLVILKLGESFPELRKQKGDFDDWILERIPDEHSFEYEVISVHKGDNFPEFSNTSAIIITGSHEMITENPEWCQKTSSWLLEAIEKQIPTLGICFGHQLLAQALGGNVDYNPNGPEYGTKSISLTDAGENNPLFLNLFGTIEVQMSHSQSIITLPAGSELLACSLIDPNSAFCYSNYVWGLQFHPEYDAFIMDQYVNDYKSSQNFSIESQNNTFMCKETTSGKVILKNFADFIKHK